MRIGIVTTWFERGASYVSRSYMELLQGQNEVFIYARGGEKQAIGDPNWDAENVTWSKRSRGFFINEKEFERWIEENSIDLIFFNEQQDWRIILFLIENHPEIIIGSYIDYYTEQTLPWFSLFDFVICNTRRHLQAMSFHQQAIFLPWGTDTHVFKPNSKDDDRPLTFFHSAGMSTRKGTELLIRAFVDKDMGRSARLVIHSQKPIDWASDLSPEELAGKGVEVICETVAAPGLYHLGDIYVYPTRLDGLGLTMYEALACGMPVIATDYPPMNEIIDDEVGRLVRVERNYARGDAYYWPMSLCDAEDLASKMRFYLDNPEQVKIQSENARKKALSCFDWRQREADLNGIFLKVRKREIDRKIVDEVKVFYKKDRLKRYFGFVEPFFEAHPWIKNMVKNKMVSGRDE